MGACGAFQAARAEVRGGMLCVRACRRAPPAVCMPKRPRIRSARAGQRPAPRHHQGEGHTAKSGRDGVLAFAVKLAQEREADSRGNEKLLARNDEAGELARLFLYFSQVMDRDKADVLSQPGGKE